jgi:hypothetical protein
MEYNEDSYEDRACSPQAGPAIISALDAEKTVENLRMGRPLAEPTALSVKRTMKHEYQVWGFFSQKWRGI